MIERGIVMFCSIAFPMLLVAWILHLFDRYAKTEILSLHSAKNRRYLERFKMEFTRERTKEQSWPSN